MLNEFCVRKQEGKSKLTFDFIHVHLIDTIVFYSLLTRWWAWRNFRIS